MPIEPGNFSLGVLAGGLIGAFASHYLTKSRSSEDRKISDFNKAAAEFRCAFTDEQRLVAESTTETDFEKIFNEAYIRQFNALIRFQAYLSENGRIEIEKAWKEHCKDYFSNAEDGLGPPKEINEDIRFMHYEHKQGIENRGGEFHITEEHGVSIKRAKQLAIKNLEKILSFAEFK